MTKLDIKKEDSQKIKHSNFALIMILFLNIIICLIAWNITWFNLSITIPEVDLIEEATMEIDLEKTNVTIHLSSDFGMEKWSVNKDLMNNDCEGETSQFLKCKQRKDASFLAKTMIVLSIFSSILVIWGSWPRKFQVPLEIHFLKYIPSILLMFSGLLWGYIMLWSSNSEKFERDIFNVFSNVPSITENIPINTNVTLFGPIFTIVTGIIMIGCVLYLQIRSKHLDV